MLRGCLLVCAACGSTELPPATVKAPATPLVGSAAVSVSNMLARVAYEDSNTWIDVAAEGTSTQARETCEALVRRLQRDKIGTLRIVVARTCEATQLPPARATGVVLIDRRDDVMQLVLDPTAAPSTLTYNTWFDSANACERWRTELAALNTREHPDTVARVKDFVSEQRAIAERRATTECEKATTAAARRCRRDDVICATVRDETRRQCERAEEDVAMLRAKENEAPPPPPVPPPCVELR
ncbi:MAG: hypothetical protein H0V17_33315 [Deltaproteobacteria bacterium]|nr:hypothetical protein [Deltaproteobacteria bacterium]